jgi:hypothetical protein
LHAIDSGIKFPKNNGNPWNNEVMNYSEFPYEVKRRFPMLGTTDTDTSRNNTLIIPRKMLSFMVLDPRGKLGIDLRGWEYVSTGKYLGPDNGEIDLYKNLLPKGTYVIDNVNALYLFSDVLGSK